MNCPACRSLMIILEYNGIEIDYCPACHGTWLDSGELELILGNPEEKAITFTSLKKDFSADEKTLNCPRCSRKMDKVSWPGNSGTILDKCPQNHGLWFDKNELIRAAKFSAAVSNKIIDQLKSVFGFTLSLTKPEE